MGLIVTNPDISLQANNGSPRIYYFADGAALFGCIGSPEGVITANARSLAITETGAVYVKTTNGVATGWSAVGGGGGGGIGGSIAATQVAVGSGANTISGSSALTFASGGLSNLQSIAGECGFLANQAVSGVASSAYFYMQTPSSAGILRLTTAGFTPSGLVKANQLDIYGGNGVVEMLLRLQDASTRFVFGINNGEAMSVNSTTTENLALGSPSTGAVPRNAQIKFYNATNAFYTQLRATAFAANRIWDLPTGSPTGTQALVGALSGSTITLDWQSISSALSATQIGFGSGANALTGSADFTYIDSTGVIELTKALNSSVRLVVTNGAGTAAQARIAVASNVSGAALAAYSSTFITSGLITANSVVLDMDGPTAMILAQSGGTFKIGLGSSTEHLRLTPTVFTLFGPNTGSVTGLTVTSATSGSGVTLAAVSSGTNEDLMLSGKGSGVVVIATATIGLANITATQTNNLQRLSGGGVSLFTSAGANAIAIGGSNTPIQIGGQAILTGQSAARLTLGDLDAAAPVAQNLAVQSVLSGTSNTSGQNFSIYGCAGTGNQPGGQIILRVAPAGSSGTSQNATIVGLAVTGPGQVYGAALHNNSAGMAGALNQYVGSATYSPTITAVANCSVTSPGVNFKYLRVGNVVQVTGQLSVDPTTASTLTRVRIALPIASNLTGSVGCQGTGACGDVFGLSGAIFPDTTNDAAELNFICESGTPANNVWCVSFSYEVA